MSGGLPALTGVIRFVCHPGSILAKARWCNHRVSGRIARMSEKRQEPRSRPFKEEVRVRQEKARKETQPKEIGGRDGPDPTRYGDWEKNGRCIDF